MSQAALYFIMGFTFGTGFVIGVVAVVKYMIDTITDKVKEAVNK